MSIERKPSQSEPEHQNPSGIQLEIRGLEQLRASLDGEIYFSDQVVFLNRVFADYFDQEKLLNDLHLQFVFVPDEVEGTVQSFNADLSVDFKQGVFNRQVMTLHELLALAQNLVSKGRVVSCPALGDELITADTTVEELEQKVLEYFLEHQAAELLEPNDLRVLLEQCHKLKMMWPSRAAEEQRAFRRLLHEKIPHLAKKLTNLFSLVVHQPHQTVEMSFSSINFLNELPATERKQLPITFAPHMNFSLKNSVGGNIPFTDSFSKHPRQFADTVEDVLRAWYEVEAIEPTNTTVLLHYSPSTNGEETIRDDDDTRELDTWQDQQELEVFNDDQPVMLVDVGGQPEAVRQAQILVNAINHPEKFTKRGARPPRGVLFTGPPGTGKTLLAKAIAHESSAEFICVEASEIVSMWYGEATQNMAKIFDNAEELLDQGKNVILFIDEVESLAPPRQAGHHHATQQIVSVLLNRLDGMKTKSGLIFLAATNHPELVDAALLRPGRIDNIIEFEYPTEEGLEEIFGIHMMKVLRMAEEPEAVFVPNLKIPALAQAAFAAQLTGADVENIYQQVIRKKIQADVEGSADWTPISTQELLDQINTYPTRSEHGRKMGFI